MKLDSLCQTGTIHTILCQKRVYNPLHIQHTGPKMSKPMMKAITFNPTTKALEIIHLPIPTPKEDEVLIRIKAFGLNRSDFLPCHSPLSNHTGSSEEEHSDPQGQIPSTEAVGVIVSPTALSSPYNSNQKVPAVLISLPLFPRKI